MMFLPRNVAALSKLAATESTRYSLTSVRLEELPEGGYRAVATDARSLGIVTERATESPTAFAPLLKSAPNGATVANVPAKDLAAALKGIPKRGGQDRAGVVLADDVTTFATTDGTNQALTAPRNGEGRFPPYLEVLPKTQPVASIKVDAKRLAALLAVAAEFTADDYHEVTLEIHPESRGHSATVMLKTKANGQEFTGLMMPLS